MSAENLDDAVHLMLFDADEEGDIALAQEAAGAGDMGELVAPLEEGVGHFALVLVLNDRDD